MAAKETPTDSSQTATATPAPAAPAAKEAPAQAAKAAPAAKEAPAAPVAKETPAAAPAAPAPVASVPALDPNPLNNEIAQDAFRHHAVGDTLFDPHKLGILNDVSIMLTIEVGRAQIKIRDLLALSKGAVIELNKSAGDPVEVYANGKLIATGNIITANGKYCVRLLSIPDDKMGMDAHGK